MNSCKIIIGLFVTTLILITIIGSISLMSNKIDEKDFGFESVKEVENVLMKRQEHISII